MSDKQEITVNVYKYSIFEEIVYVCVLVFLFNGEPDAWDKLHNYVMTSLEQSK